MEYRLRPVINTMSPLMLIRSEITIHYRYNIYTQEQAQERANYEFYLHNNMNEQVNIELQPLYFLDVNTLIEFDKPDIELQGRFLIDNITIPLSYDGTMSLSTHKVYPIE